MCKLQSLKRPFKTESFLPEIDGLRFPAILSVCLLHLNNFYGRSINYDYYEGVRDINSWSWFINRSGLGVELFFAISGFIIALPFIKHSLNNNFKTSIKAYFIRRLTRLEIPFLLSCIVFYIAFTLNDSRNLLDGLGHFFATITYTHVFIYGEWTPFNPVTWSLETEIQFYIMAPWLIHIMLKPRSNMIKGSIFLCLFALPLILNYHFFDFLKQYHLHMSIILFLPYFMTGILIAYLFFNYQSFFKVKSIAWDVIGLLSFYCLFYFAWSPNQFYFCFFLFLLFLSTFKGAFLNYLFTREIIFTLGGMCYTLYLLHYPLIHLIGRYTKQLSVGDSFLINYFIQAIIILPVIFGIASIYFLLIEKPCMNKNWPHDLYHRIICYRDGKK
jgi:peptidoglycan/LPS O-acetylase OafA/YrhL